MSNCPGDRTKGHVVKIYRSSQVNGLLFLLWLENKDFNLPCGLVVVVVCIGHPAKGFGAALSLNTWLLRSLTRWVD